MADYPSALKTELTLGFCGTYNGQAAFVTAGHSSALASGNLYYGYDDPVGPVLKQQFADGGYGDYAIVKVEDTAEHPLTNTIHLGGGVTGAIHSYYNEIRMPEGQLVLVAKYGAVSGVTAGEVTSSNTQSHPCAPEGSEQPYYTVYGMVEITNTVTSMPITVPGDSGGPAYRVLENGEREALGVMSSRDITDGHNVAYFTPFYYMDGFVPNTAN